MIRGGKERPHGGAAVRREPADERPFRHDVREGVCHRNDIVEHVVDGEPEGWRTPAGVSLASDDEVVGDLDGTTLATTLEVTWASHRWRAPSPKPAGADSEDATARCIHAYKHAHRRTQCRAVVNPHSRAVTTDTGH